MFLPGWSALQLEKIPGMGVKYILHQGRVLLGDEMGLGKTIQAIAAMVSLRNTGATHFVVLCPASVIINWCREIGKFSKLRAIKVHGSSRLSALDEWIRMGGVAVTTYETTAYFKLPDDFKFSSSWLMRLIILRTQTQTAQLTPEQYAPMLKDFCL